MKAPKCRGTNRQGEPCGLPAGYDTDHQGHGNCKFHGGATRNGKTHALNEQAKATIARLDLPPVEDPLSELARVCAQVLAWKDDMAGRVAELSGLRYENENGGEQLRAEVALWERALDRCERFLTAMARLNIDERLARISEARALVVIEVLVAALDAGGIEGDQRAKVLAAADEGFGRLTLVA